MDLSLCVSTTIATERILILQKAFPDAEAVNIPADSDHPEHLSSTMPTIGSVV